MEENVMDHRELLQKMLTTNSFFTAGLLQPEQQDQFITYVRGESTLLRAVRFVRMDRFTMEIDKMHIGEPITEAAEEAKGSTYDADAAFTKVVLNAKKIRSRLPYSVETLIANIEGPRFENTIIQRMSERIGVDMELLALNGDTAHPAPLTPEGRLLKRDNGWMKLAEGAHVLDVGGDTIRKEIFAEAKHMLPKDYRRDPGLRFLCSQNIADNWLTTLSDRGGEIGVGALRGTTVKPYGVPLLEVPLMSDDLAVTVGTVAASPAQVLGNRQGPFVIRTGVNDTLVLNFDAAAGGPITITFPQGTYETVTMVKMINDAITASGLPPAGIAGLGRCATHADGKLVLESNLLGGSSAVLIGADGPPPGTGPSNANDTLGFTAGTVTGSAGGAGGTVNEGSEMLLCNPKNLIFGILTVPRVGNPQSVPGAEGTRMYSKYDEEVDSVIVTTYNFVAMQIENLEAVVKVKNIRRKRLY
jgi:hypothetical protein